MESRRGWLSAKESLATATIWTIAALVVLPLGWILFDLFARGYSQLSASFLLSVPVDAGRAGGIAPLILSTLLVLAVTLAVAAPLGFASAVALADAAQRRSRFAWLIRCSLDLLAAVPSIVFGLFGNAFFCVLLGMGYSIVSGGLTLACMILPILILTSEQALRGVPLEHRLGAAALGLSRTTTLFRVELPVAAPTMAAGLVLGIGRALGETAALIFTAGYVTRTPQSLWDSGRALSVHIYDLAMNVPGGNERAYATAAVLVAMLLLINAVTMALTRYASASSLLHTRKGIGG